MKRNGKYRFSLQFGSDTEEQIQVGELLERLGNKKSVVVIAAMMEYIHAHPEISEEEEKVEVSVSSGMGRFEVESLVRRIVGEEMRHQTLRVAYKEFADEQRYDDDVAQLLDNIDLF